MQFLRVGPLGGFIREGNFASGYERDRAQMY